MTNNKDPWGNNPRREAPPDLDEIFLNIKRKIGRLFGANKKMQAFSDQKQPSGWLGIGLVFGLILLVWSLAGIFVVSPAQRAVILRFGKYARTVGPGPHWVPRFIETDNKVNVQKIMTYPYSAKMLTKDENIVFVSLAVQYRIDNARNYLFNAVNPNESLQQATASALRQVVGSHILDEVLTTGREQIRAQVVKQITKILAGYNVGLVIADVALQPAKPPEAVTEAFDDVNKAREDEQRYINEAKAYQQKVVPIAQGKAKRILQEAMAFQKQTILKANAQTAGYLALLPQFKKNPKIIKARLYINTMEQVLSKSSKMLIDTKLSNNIIYLPLDKFLATKKVQTHE